MRQVNRNMGLIKEFNKGNPRAFKTIHDTFFPALTLFATRLINNDMAGEEFAADSLIKLFAKCKDFQTLNNIKAFLYITTKHSCLNFLASTQRHQALEKKLSYFLSQDHEEHILNEMIRVEIMRYIRLEIEELPRMCQRVFKHIYFEGNTVKEVSNLLNISVNTVLAHRARAIEKIRTRLLKQGMLGALLYLYLAFQCKKYSTEHSA